jgi:hypothetical protein
MEVDEEPSKNGSSATNGDDKLKKPSTTSKDVEEGEVVDAESTSEIAAPALSKWKQATGASVDLSRIRVFAAKVDEDNEEESDEDEGIIY